MINNICINIIEFYQKNISPHKGYTCAYKHFTGKNSCSEFTKKCISEYGVIKTIPLFINQINECKTTYSKNNNKDTNSCEKGCNGCGTVAPCL
jgi:putative component of membrane protein insertase Oxa1/YidC/SpoIIIJ protein YidD